MKRSHLLPGAALLAVSALLILTVVPAAALTIKGEGYYSRFQFGGQGQGGIVIVDKVDSNSGRANALLVGVVASEEYFIVGRSIGCNGTPSTSNRVFRATKLADVNGDVHVSAAIVLKDVLVSSIWIGRTDGAGTTSCRPSVHFERVYVATGDVNGDGALGVWEQDPATAIVVVEKRPNSQARVSIVVDPQDRGEIYVVSLANRACGHAPTNSFKIQLDGAGYSVHDIHINQGGLNALRSVRVRSVSESKFVGCAPSVLIALLLP